VAKIFSDGFDWASAITDLTLRWDSYTGIPSLQNFANTQFGYGQSLEWDVWPVSGTLTKTLGSNETTFYGSFRFQRITANTTSTLEITFRESGTSQVTLIWSDGNLTVRSGSNSGTIIGTASGINTGGSWESYQFRIVIGNTTGQVEVRRNANSTPILNITGVNTRGGTANAYINSVVYTFSGSSGGSNIRVDDLFLSNATGAEPTGWPGDIRVAILTPSSAGAATQFTSSSAGTYGNTASNSSFALNANNIRFQSLTSSHAGQAQSATVYLPAALVGNMNVAIYANDGPSGQPGTKLSEATPITNPGAGFQTFTFATSPSITRGEVIWLGVLTDANVNLYSSATTTQSYVVANSYDSGFPESLASPSLSTTNIPIMYGTVTATYFNYSATETHDGDTSYVSSSTPGHKDFYRITPLPGTAQTIVTVEPFGFFRKTDTGARTFGVMIRSGTIESTVVTDTVANSSYVYVGGTVATDPDGSLPWTVPALNATQIGPTIVS